MTSYETILEKLRDLNSRIDAARQAIARERGRAESGSSARISRLEQQIAKIEEYLPRVRAFQELAKRNLDSLSVLTIEAPPGYRVNLNRLRNWAMLIDPTASNDPYAQRVYAVAKCDEFFLQKKKAEFAAKIEELKGAPGDSPEIAGWEAEIEALDRQRRDLAASPETTAFLRALQGETDGFWYKTAPRRYRPRDTLPAAVSPGAVMAPLPFPQDQCRLLRGRFGNLVDGERCRVALPARISFEKKGESASQEFFMTVTCAPVKSKHLDKGLQNLLLQLLLGYPLGLQKLWVLDGMRFNASCLGDLKQLEGTFVLPRVPRNPEQLTGALEAIVSSFADMEELLDIHDSVEEYNRSVEDPARRLPFTTLVLQGWPGAYEGRDRELIQRILTNYERYGLSVITVSYHSSEKEAAREDTFFPAYALQRAIRVRMTGAGSSIAFPEEAPQEFQWYPFLDSLGEEFVASLNAAKPEREVLGTRYDRRYPLDAMPAYTRSYQKIELPFGVDGKDQVHSLSFENENFAAYLVGASRSGKSTLIHVLIASLIRNYHPDNVELWLADFKQLEFQRYIAHRPPHVKYVLLDESMELVFDLIDKLTQEMMERQALFSRLGVQRIDQLDPTALEKPLPVIFVILDEFSIMSQSIAESPTYKLRLQNLLAKGAALGFRFLFSSQTFTTGVSGLTPTARAQIQQRIAMRSAKEEISETLELSASAKTDQVRNWMDALPPHYALVKFRVDADTPPQVKRYQVMYFPDYDVRDGMIDLICRTMKPGDTYDPGNITSYVDKHPVLVDGNSYQAFDPAAFQAQVEALGKEDLFLSLGAPRLMEPSKLTTLSQETRENLLLLTRGAEQPCTAAILAAAVRCLRLQGVWVRLWAYEKDRLFRAYGPLLTDLGAEAAVGMEAICREIRALKEGILRGAVDRQLILLVGMDRICGDFDYVLEKKPEPVSGTVTTDREAREKALADGFFDHWRPLRAKLQAEGRTREEILAAQREEYTRYMAEATAVPETPAAPEAPKAPEPSGAYNAGEDFAFAVKQGSRLGCHFLLVLNSLADLRTTGLKQEFFRCRLAFRQSLDDSRMLFGSRVASALGEHVCQVDDGIESFSFRPWLHPGIGWDGWSVVDGEVQRPY